MRISDTGQKALETRHRRSWPNLKLLKFSRHLASARMHALLEACCWVPMIQRGEGLIIYLPDA